MSGMSALLAYGYVLSTDHTLWELVESPGRDAYGDTIWPNWVDPNDPIDSYRKRLCTYYMRQGLGPKSFEHPVQLELSGNYDWDSLDVIIYVRESKHEADDIAMSIDEFVVHSTGWNTHLYDALAHLGIRTIQQGPKWFLAPSYCP